MTLPRLTPALALNLLCLGISAGAAPVAIGLTIGIPTGAVIALTLLNGIVKQNDPLEAVRKQALWGVLIAKVWSAAFEQMAYADYLEARRTLPFEWTFETWAYLCVIFIAVLDALAYLSTAVKASALSQAQAEQNSIERMDKQNADRLEADRRLKLELAEIEARTQLDIVRTEQQTLADIRRQEEDTKRTLADIERQSLDIQADIARQQADIERQRLDKEEQAADLQRQREDKDRRDRDKKERELVNAAAQKKEKERIRKAAERARKRELATLN